MGEYWPHGAAYSAPSYQYASSSPAYGVPTLHPTRYQEVAEWAWTRYAPPSSAGTVSSHYTDSTLRSGISHEGAYVQAPATHYTHSSAGATGTPSYVSSYSGTSTAVHPSSSVAPKKGFKLFGKREPVTSTWYAIPDPVPAPPRKPNKLQKKQPPPPKAATGGLANRIGVSFGVTFGRDHTEGVFVRRK